MRWPARPAEHRAGLDFFGSFCIKAKRTERIRLKLSYFLCLEAKNSTKKIQGQTNGFARLSGPTHMKSHYNLKILLVM